MLACLGRKRAVYPFEEAHTVILPSASTRTHSDAAAHGDNMDGLSSQQLENERVQALPGALEG